MDPSSEADRLFAELVARGEAVTEAAVRALCTEHPEHAAELTRLYEDWRRLQSFFERLGAPRELHEALRASLAETRREADSTVGGGGDAYVEEIVRRLLDREGAVSRYRVGEELARGGMGAIRRVYDEDLRRNLAMKIILDEFDLRDSSAPRTPADDRRIARFLEEAQVAGQLDHPGIVPVHELGLDGNGRLYFTMKMVKGRTLLDVFEQVRSGEDGWNVPRAIAALQKVCEAMAYAHDKHVIHRDLKPSNVMIGKFGEVYVMDWGLARVLDREDRKDVRIRSRSEPPPSVVETERHTRKGGHPDSPLYTMDGDVVGTPAYMAPEQARGDLDDVGPPADVYGVGAMLYHLLAGEMPFVSPDPPSDNYEILARLRSGPPRPLHELAGTAPAELLSICEKAMARRIDDRFRSMSELAENLRAYLEGHVVPAHRTGPIAELSKWCARNRALAASLAALLVVVVAGSFFFAWSERDKRNRLATSFAATEAEREAKTRLSDVMTARFLGPDLDAHAPDAEGIGRMESWLQRLDEIVGRADEHRARAADPSTAATERAELEEMLATVDDLREQRPAVAAALESAQGLPARTVDEHADDWAEAIAAIRSSPRYGGTEITPQVGLVPLGENEQGLWEFWSVLSGARPVGRMPREEHGLIMVLVPGGSFVMGSMPDSPYHEQNEFPHERFVEPFFLSKYEMTQAQYVRIAGENPAQYPPGTVRLQVATTPLNPVENLDWYAASSVCRRLGLRLPTEPEWEYAAKAGEETLFHWGDTPGVLEGKENVGDAATAEIASAAGQAIAGLASWSDGYPLHAPIGSFAPNRFGCFDVLGNVGEWTSSRYERDYGQASAPVATTEADRRKRVARGGSHRYGPAIARSTMRQPLSPETPSFMLGVRAARSLRP